jgi:hypothetical protein
MKKAGVTLVTSTGLEPRCSVRRGIPHLQVPPPKSGKFEDLVAERRKSPQKLMKERPGSPLAENLTISPDTKKG